MTDRELMQQALDSFNKMIGRKPEFVEQIISALQSRLAQPEQEPVAWANSNDLQNFDMRVRTNGGPLHTVPLYTTPPHRPWVGLTDKDEIPWDGVDAKSFARAIEAKLKEKNT